MRYAMLFAAVLAVALPSVGLAQSIVQVGARAPDFSLKDQFGKDWSISGMSGKVTVLVAANPDSGRLMDPWVSGLKTRYDTKGVQVVGLLDLRSVPGIGRGIARSRIRRETKDPMILDFSGRVGRAYGVSSKYPVVVALDRAGIVRAVTGTTYSQQAFSQITGAVDAALAAKRQ